MRTFEAVLIHTLSALPQSPARLAHQGIIGVTPHNFRNAVIGRRFHRVTILNRRVFSEEQLADLRLRCASPDVLWLE